MKSSLLKKDQINEEIFFGAEKMGWGLDYLPLQKRTFHNNIEYVGVGWMAWCLATLGPFSYSSWFLRWLLPLFAHLKLKLLQHRASGSFVSQTVKSYIIFYWFYWRLLNFWRLLLKNMFFFSVKVPLYGRSLNLLKVCRY